MVLTRPQSPARQPCIVGIGETTYTKWGKADRSELELACEAILRAVADAGLAVDDLDGFASFAYDRNEPDLIAEALGIPVIRHTSMVWGGGGHGSFASIANAAAAVVSGQADFVVVFRSVCQGQSFRYGQHYPTPHSSLLAPFGMMSPPHMFAPVAQRYKHLYGMTPQQTGRVAIDFRANAMRNPRAVMGKDTLTMDTYLASRMIADPLRLYDCCLESDGACALIVTSLERARDLRARPVTVLASGYGTEPGRGTGILGSHNMPDESYARGDGVELCNRLFGAAGVDRKDLDVAQIYDAYSPQVLMTLEAAGICGIGEAGAFAEAGGLSWPNGTLPANTSGGLLSEAYIHGLNLAVEAVRQIRGESTSQVPGAELAFISCGTSAAILGA